MRPYNEIRCPISLPRFINHAWKSTKSAFADSRTLIRRIREGVQLPKGDLFDFARDRLLAVVAGTSFAGLNLTYDLTF